MNARAEDVVAFYRAFLQRDPESAEAIYSKAGRPLADVALEFARCWEFQHLEREAAKETAARSYQGFAADESTPEPSSDGELTNIATHSAERPAATHEPPARQAETVQRLHSILFPQSKLSREWFEQLAVILDRHAVSILDVLAYFRGMLIQRNGFPYVNPKVAESLTGPADLNNFRSRITLAVFIRNSDRWLRHLIDFYKDRGLSPTFIVDTTTSEAARGVLAERGAAQVEVDARRNSSDSLISAISAHNTSDWILQLSDDELPTPALLRFVDQAVEYSSEFRWGFSSLYCRYDAARHEPQYSQFLPFGPFGATDLQWRLVQRNRKDLSAQDRVARPDALLLNFGWIVRSFAESLENVERCKASAHEPGASRFDFYHEQALPESWHMFAPVPDGAYKVFLTNLYESTRDA